MTLQAKDLFEAQTSNVWETFMSHNSAAGYKIPEYQRDYTWTTDNINRLLEDCLNGFSRLSQANDQGFTFLGSIILTTGGREATFDGVSLFVIDGQQRLTSLILATCALFELITTHREDLKNANKKIHDWIKLEYELQLVSLRQCALGQIQRLDRDVYFPRLVRAADHRGSTPAESEYRSPLARFLVDFEKYSSNTLSTFPPTALPSEAGTHLLAMYSLIKERMVDYIYEDAPADDGPLDVMVVDRTHFNRPGYTSLWRRLEAPTQREQDRKTALLAKEDSCEGLVRLLLFSSYFMQRVVLTRVESQDEEYAFDMFDSLNTTGDPLTALETCKPLVVAFENADGTGYSGSDSQESWETLDGILQTSYPAPSKRQDESKRLLTSFALYLEGHKLPLDASSQRYYLRDKFRRAARADAETARGFVRALKDLAEFRAQYWETQAIDGLGVSALGAADSDRLRLCLRFIADMKTTLAIPVLARYWTEFGDSDHSRAFLRAAMAVAAFLALRRASTGSTAGIDADFRRLMKDRPPSGGDPLSKGRLLGNELMPVDALQQELRRLLKQEGIELTRMDTWLNRAAEVEAGLRSPQPLNRFLLFAAHHNARCTKVQPGLLTKDDAVPGSDVSFLTHQHWMQPEYGTVEHVAPRSERGIGWDADIYRRQSTKHLLGNLVLLPEKENQAIGNAPWAKKKAFYSALASSDRSEREAFLQEADKKGYGFGRKTENLLRGQERLHMLDPIVEVPEWTETLVPRTNAEHPELGLGRALPLAQELMRPPGSL